MAILMNNPDQFSMVSFFVESHHRLFGGNTLACVPFAFCTQFYETKNEYCVYRHTFKVPNFKPTEIHELTMNGPPEQRIKAFAYTKSRDGYRTIPGMTYVGITKRQWQERYLEHIDKSLKKSSSTNFHKAIRLMQGQKVICVHDVTAYGLSKTEAKKYESKLIKESSLWPKGLNMRL